MKYLMTISLGPVQEFIASARRSRDLWFGSWLLSELSRAAAEVIVNRHKKESLIFPSVSDPNELLPDTIGFSVVNKLVAIVDDPQTVGTDMETAIRRCLADIRAKAYEKLPDVLTLNGTRRTDVFLATTAAQQVADVPEFFWAACELAAPNDPRQYQAARQQAESLLAARKATRNFAPVTWGANVPKSGLDGQREAVIHEDAYDALTPEQLRRNYGVRPGERLCGVGLLKRHGNRTTDDSFFSTAHVAALPFMSGVAPNAEKEAAFETYIKQLTDLGLSRSDLNPVPVGKDTQPHPVFGRHDGGLLFEERLGEYFAGNHEQDKKNLKAAQDALRKFLKTACQGQQPKPYYALLLADGDRMGQAIDHEARQGLSRHQELSAQLSAFAKAAPGIVETAHQGSLVYAGGDDVLAFVPLHQALACARALACKFAAELAKFKNDKGQSPTLSVGLALVHQMEPLQDSLELARQAEKAAKAVAGKNALCVLVSKRSGADFQIAGTWGTLDRRLDYFTLLHRAEAIPDGAAYELRAAARDLAGLPPQAQHDEVARILKRKKAKQGTEKIAEKTLNKLLGYLAEPETGPQQPAEEKSPAQKAEEATRNLKQLADELIAARLLAAATKQAGLTVDELSQQIGIQEGKKQ